MDAKSNEPKSAVDSADPPPSPTLSNRPLLGKQISSTWMPLAITLLGLAVTAWGTLAQHAQLRETDRQRFNVLTERLKGEISRRVGLYRNGLTGLRALYAASKVVQRAEFRTAVSLHDLPTEFPGTLGIGYVRRVKRSDVDAFLAETRADGAPNFTLHTQGDHPDLMVIEFVEPLAGNRDAEGFDIGQEASLRATAERAMETGEASLTPKVSLVQAQDRGPGCLFLLPVYTSAFAPPTVEARRAQLQGWLYMPILASELFRAAARVTDDELDFDVFEGDTPSMQGLVYDEDADLRDHAADFDPNYYRRRGLFTEAHLELGGRRWIATMVSTDRFREQSLLSVGKAALAGVALSVLLGLLLRGQGSAVRRARALADSMTADVRRLAMVAERSTNGVMICDARRRITWLNHGFTRITGHRSEDLLGRELTVTIDFEKSDPDAVQRLDDALAGGMPFRGELVRASRGGSARWLDADVQPLRDERGELVGFVAVETDITENTRAKSALQESQAKLELLLDSTGEAIYGVDLAGNFTFCNPACARALGYRAPRDLLGRNAHVLIHHTHADGRGHPVEECPIYLVSRTGEACHVTDDKFWRKDGSGFWVEYSCHPQRSEGRIVGAVVTFVDIGERKRLEAANARAVGQLAVANAALEEAQSVGRLGSWRLEVSIWRMEWSKQLFQLFERDPSAGPVDYPEWQALFVDDDAARHDQLIKQAAEHGTGYSVTLQRARSTNAVRYVRVEGRARREGDRVVSLFGTAMDVTAEIEREESLRIAQRRAEDASRSKSEFLANMSHEIRTPMTAIVGFAELLAEDGPGSATREQRQEYCATIKRNGEHLLSIINDILDISKIEAGMLKVERVDTDLTKLLGDVIPMMTVTAGAKGLSLQYGARTPLPLAIKTDPVRFRQILINLIGNAVKFTERGSVTVSASLEVNRGSFLRFDIADTGIGMTEEQGTRIFGAFEQADSSTTRKFGGTGLGLQISKRLAQMLGGDISFRSELGKGSVFSLTLDTAAVSSASTTDGGPMRVQPLAAPPGQPRGRDQPLRGARILLAEDGLDNQRLIAFHLNRAGAELTIVDNGKLAVEALCVDAALSGELITPAPFDLILTDMQMPIMDGYVAARLLRDKGCRLPIVALTAHAMSGDADKCLRAGCDGYATKPIDRVQLLEICGQALRGELQPPRREDNPAAAQSAPLRPPVAR